MSGSRGKPKKTKSKVLVEFWKQQESGNLRRILTNIFIPASADITEIGKRVKEKYSKRGWLISKNIRVVRGQFFHMSSEKTTEAA